MVIVTGSKQSGTALVVPMLVAAGYPLFGAPTEASLRHGINYQTNPHPVTAAYLFPEQVRGHVMEMFPFGVTRTDRAFIDHVLVVLRPLGEHVAAARRLHALEDATMDGPAPPRLDPALEWWAENYALVRDFAIRRYPAHFETLGRLVRDPGRVITEVVAWLGSGDAARAIDAVKPEDRAFESTDDVSLDPGTVALCNELHAAIDARQPLPAALLSNLNDAQVALLPRLRAESERLERGTHSTPFR